MRSDPRQSLFVAEDESLLTYDYSDAGQNKKMSTTFEKYVEAGANHQGYGDYRWKRQDVSIITEPQDYRDEISDDPRNRLKEENVDYFDNSRNDDVRNKRRMRLARMAQKTKITEEENEDLPSEYSSQRVTYPTPQQEIGAFEAYSSPPNDQGNSQKPKTQEDRMNQYIHHGSPYKHQTMKEVNQFVMEEPTQQWEENRHFFSNNEMMMARQESNMEQSVEATTVSKLTWNPNHPTDFVQGSPFTQDQWKGFSRHGFNHNQSFTRAHQGSPKNDIISHGAPQQQIQNFAFDHMESRQPMASSFNRFQQRSHIINHGNMDHRRYHHHQVPSAADAESHLSNYYDERSLLPENTAYQCTSVITNIWTTIVGDRSHERFRHFERATSFTVHRNMNDVSRGKRRPLLNLDNEDSVIPLPFDDNSEPVKNALEALGDIKTITETAAEEANNALSKVINATSVQAGTIIGAMASKEDQSLSTIFQSFEQEAENEPSPEPVKLQNKKEGVKSKLTELVEGPQIKIIPVETVEPKPVGVVTESSNNDHDVSNEDESPTDQCVEEGQSSSKQDTETVWESTSLLDGNDDPEKQQKSEGDDILNISKQHKSVTEEVEKLLLNFFEELDDLDTTPSLTKDHTQEPFKSSSDILIHVSEKDNASELEDLGEGNDRNTAGETTMRETEIAIAINKEEEAAWMATVLGEDQSVSDISVQKSTKEIRVSQQEIKDLEEVASPVNDEELLENDLCEGGNATSSESWKIKVVIILFYLYASDIFGAFT